VRRGTAGTISTILKIITHEISQCDIKISETEKSKDQTEKYRKQIKEAQSNKEVLEGTIEYVKAMRKEVVKYNTKKKEKSLNGIYAAINSAKAIIPDIVPVRLSMIRESACIVNEKDDDINLVEGSGFRATLSLFARSQTLMNTDYIKTMVLDELLMPLSPETSARASKYLPILARKAQIILIEQKNEVFLDADITIYDFKKSEDCTKVRLSRQ
jgi:DNA repair ATPase RecN